MFITLTGAEDSVAPEKLIELAESFSPGRVEFGILYSAERAGTGRYPTKAWITRLLAEVGRLGSTRLSLHLCGREAILGYFFNSGFVGEVSPLFGRVQLNLRALDYIPRLVVDGIAKHPVQTVITQYNPNNASLTELLSGLKNHAVLFDGSGGRGVCPEKWEGALSDVPHGYAGGLGPDNLEIELRNIMSVASPGWWVDMESKLRDERDQFDLGTARRCAEIFDSLVPRAG